MSILDRQMGGIGLRGVPYNRCDEGYGTLCKKVVFQLHPVVTNAFTLPSSHSIRQTSTPIEKSNQQLPAIAVILFQHTAILH